MPFHISDSPILLKLLSHFFNKMLYMEK